MKIAINFLLILLIINPVILFSQIEKIDKSTNSTKAIVEAEETEDDIKIKNSSGDVLLKLVSENDGEGISFFIPPLSSIDSYLNKLYNLDNKLYWNGLELGGGSSGGPWSTLTNNAYLVDTINHVGIGTNAPEQEFHVKNGNIYVEGDETWFLGLNIKNHGGRSVLQLQGRSNDGANRSSEILLRDISTNSNWSILNTESNHMIFMSSREGVNETPIKLKFGAPTNSLTINSNGNVGIGDWSNDHKLAVAGSIISEEVVVKLQADWPDYVFSENYELQDLQEVENFIKANKHLKGIPPADQIKDRGISLADIQIKLLEKIEELTLYVIQQEKDIKSLENELNGLKQKYGGEL